MSVTQMLFNKCTTHKSTLSYSTDVESPLYKISPKKLINFPFSGHQSCTVTDICFNNLSIMSSADDSMVLHLADVFSPLSDRLHEIRLVGMDRPFANLLSIY